eukprot:EG_transcript_12597
MPPEDRSMLDEPEDVPMSREPPEANPSSAIIQAIPEMAHYCFHVLECHFKGMKPTLVPDAIGQLAAALFTGWYRAGQLRGCIGSLVPYPLHENLRDRALDAALNDRRFQAIQVSELPQLTCSVNILHSFEDARDSYDWTIGTHGLTIEFSDPHRTSRTFRATYLPSVMVKFGMTKEVAIQELVRKAGYNGPVNAALLRTMSVNRFQSSELESGYAQYVAYYTHLKGKRKAEICFKDGEEEDANSVGPKGSSSCNGVAKDVQSSKAPPTPNEAALRSAKGSTPSGRKKPSAGCDY